MSQSNVSLKQIMDLKKEVEPIYQKLNKTYQEELFFIQKKVEKDAYREHRIESCCWALPFSSEDGNDYKKNTYKNYSKYNPRLYSLFKHMNLNQRKQYFFQLLTFIKEMNSLYQTYANQQIFKYDTSGKKLRQKIINKLKKKFTNKQILQKIDQKGSNSFFEATVIQEKDSSRIVCQMCHYKLYFKSQHVETVVDLRNYLIIEEQTNEQKRSIYMEAIYQEVKPTKLRVNFLLPEDSQKYIPAFREIVQIGKIQKLLANINMSKIQINNGRKSIENNDILKNTFLIANQDFSDDELQEPETIIGAQKLSEQYKLNKIELKLKKKVTLKILKNQEIKQKLIQTLEYLAHKKQDQNEKIRQFQDRQVIMESRKRSDAIERLLMRNQNCFVHPIRQQITKKQIFEYLVKDNIDKTDCLHIINNNSNIGNQHLMQRRTDSFINNDDELQFQKAQPSHIKKKKISKLKFFKNLFAEMYPQYSLQNMFNIIGMERKIMTEQIYNIPQKFIKGELKTIKIQKQIKAQQVWLDKFNSICKLFQRRDNENFIKISLALKVQATSLVLALINVQAYSFWHPNITKVTILSVISSDNAINYKIECTDQTGDKYGYQLFMHVFKVENKYYILQKSIDWMDNNGKTGNIFFDYLYPWKQKPKMHRFKFMLLRASTSDKNGFTDILIEAQLDQSQSNISEKIKREDISFLLNFNLIPKYWQLDSCMSLFQNRLNAEWVVSNQHLEQQDDEDLDFGNRMGRMPLEKLQSPVKIDMVSSQEYLSTSSYYDI